MEKNKQIINISEMQFICNAIFNHIKNELKIEEIDLK